MSTHGGYRHGRKRDESAKKIVLHCYITPGNHERLREVGMAAGLTRGEVVDRLIEGHIRRKERKNLVSSQDSALIPDNCQIQ